MPREYQFFVYILTNRNHRVMYIGMTNDLARRVYQHKNHVAKGFTDQYNVTKLVYFETTSDVHSALAREKEIKRWRREKKNALVTTTNADWRDLSVDFSLRSK